MVAVKRAAFQSIASMYVHPYISYSHVLINFYIRALPAFTIHTAVRQAKKAFVNVSNPRVKAWGPTLTGLSIVPGLPYLFDHPVEVATDTVFEWIEKQIARQEDKVETEELKNELKRA